MSERYLEYLGPRQYGAKKTGERSKSCAIEKQQKVGISSIRKRRSVESQSDTKQDA